MKVLRYELCNQIAWFLCPNLITVTHAKYNSLSTLVTNWLSTRRAKNSVRTEIVLGSILDSVPRWGKANTCSYKPGLS